MGRVFQLRIRDFRLRWIKKIRPDIRLYLFLPKFGKALFPNEKMVYYFWARFLGWLHYPS
jgi:hypothetical protein